MDSPETTIEPPAEPYKGSPGSLAIIILSVLIPGLVLLTCLLASIFLCWYRDRIPIFRSKATRYSSPAAKTQVPLSKKSGQGYPTQHFQTPSTEENPKSEMVVEGGDNLQDVTFKEDAQEFDTVHAVKVYASTKL